MKSPLIEDLNQWPISKLSVQRDEFVQQVIKDVDRQFNHLGSLELDQALSKTIFQERQRVKSNPWKADPPNEAAYFKKLLKEYNESKESEISFQKNKESTHRLIHRYTEEIAGSFTIPTFHFARKILSRFFEVVYNPLSFSIFYSTKKLQGRLSKKMIINGEIDLVRKLFPGNSIVLVPTHSSNLDSILVGFMSHAFGGMPAFTYGAGLNLFDSEFFAFFMNRLGAYRVDRRKKNPIYLNTLSTYSRLIVEKGVNMIFFPGGTRSRSGEVETKLKLGLLNAVLLAQRNLLERKDSRKVIIVPVVIGYESVLEARSLILQHLRASGQEKFIVREKNSPIKEYINFIWGLIKKESKVYLTFGQPIDVFGNAVNDQGKSIHHLGGEIHLEDYFIREEMFVHDSQRESIYTKELAESIVSQYRKFNFITPSHLVSFCAFRFFKNRHHGIDDIALVQLPEEEFNFSIDEFEVFVQEVINNLQSLEKQKKVTLSEELYKSVQDIIQEGINRAGIFHNRKVLFVENNRLQSDDLFTLYYYYNKLVNLESEIFEH
ncbi:MAG: glycerol acyltransferase [Saprospiraceae bacterium]|nr:glycerol acyltransferase [Saprospiraceae bacterium]